MNKQNSLLKTLLVVAGLLVGMSSWAQTTTVGAEDNSSAFWTQFSDYYTIQPNQTLRISFNNYSDKAENYHNWIAAVTTDFDRAGTQTSEDSYWEYLILRTDNYGWGNAYADGTLSCNYNWDTYKDDMNASHVEMTVSRSGSTVTVRADITTSAGTQYYEQWVGACGAGTQNIRFFLSTEMGHLTDLASNNAEASIFYLHQDYEDATDASSWSSPNGVLNLVTGDATYGKYITLTQTGGGQRSGSTNFVIDGISTLSSYTLDFDWKYSALSDRQNQLVVYTNSFVGPGNNNYYNGNDALINLYQTAHNATTFKIDNNADDLVTLDNGAWYHFSLSVDAANEKVTTTITKVGGNDVLSNHEASKTGVNLQMKGIWSVVGRSSTVASFDNFFVKGVGRETISTSVSVSAVNLATGSATLAISAESNAVNSTFKHYYSVSNLLTNPVEIANGSVILASGTYYFYSVNTATGSKSNAVQYVVDATENVAAPVVSVSGNTVTVTSGTSNAGSTVTSYAVKYATSADPATDGVVLAEGANTMDQGFYYIYTVSEYGNVSEPVYAEVVCRNTETFAIKNLYDGEYRTINNSGTGTNGYNITTFTNSSGTVGRYINGRFQFWYQSGNGNNWWMRESSRPLFVSVGKSSNFAVKVSADDAVVFTGSTLSFVEGSNVYGVSAGDAVISGKVYFAQNDGYIVINGGAYAVITNVVVYTNDEIFTTLSASEAMNGLSRVITVNPAYSTSDATVNTYYTTDGTTPTSASTLVEDNEITIVNDCTLKIASINTVTGNSSNVVSKDVVCGSLLNVYDFSATALTEAYGGTTITTDQTETRVARINSLDYFQAYCGDGDTKTAIENMAISKNGGFAYSSGKDGLYNSGGGYRALAFLNAKKGQKFVFTTTDGSESAEISAITNATSQAIGTTANTWVFVVDADGTVAFNSHRYSYINKIEIYDRVTVPATVGVNGYTTFASPYALDLTDANRPEGLKAYKATLTGKTLSFTELNQTVAAGTGLLLLGETKGDTYDIPVVATGDAVETALTGVITPTAKQSNTAGDYYFVMKKAKTSEDALTFAPLSTTQEVTIPAGKAYVTVPSSAFTDGARTLGISFDDVTIVDAARLNNHGEMMNESVYNLQGQRVAQPVKGLYIMNGKKVIIK